MGLPRYIQETFEKHISNCQISGFEGLQHAFLAGVDSDSERFFELLNKKKVPFNKLIRDQLKFRYKYSKSGCFFCEKTDRLKKVNIKWYVGLEKERGQWIAKKINAKVSAFMIQKLEAISSDREKKDRAEITLRDKIVSFQHKVYASRNFPEKLKQVIFQRDNYKCQICGKNRELVIADGLHLEVDHITEWEDGGETTYKNGQTLCSACNKGKYHAKHHIYNKQNLLQ